MMPEERAKDTSLLNRLSCCECSHAGECLPHHLAALVVTELEGVIGHTHILHCGECLFQSGDAFKGQHVIHSGTEACSTDEAGRDTILGLHLPTGIVRIGNYAIEITQTTENAVRTARLRLLPPSAGQHV